MAGTAAVNKQLLSRVLFLEEKVSALMHQTGTQTGTQHAPASPCTVRVRGLARTSTAHRAGDGLLKPLGSPGTLPFSPMPTSTTPLPGRGHPRQREERQRGQAALCLRCQVGPKHHGGHNRQDPHCVFHGQRAMNGGEALAFLKKKRAQTTTSSRSTRSPRTRPTTCHEPPAVSQTNYGGEEAGDKQRQQL